MREIRSPPEGHTSHRVVFLNNGKGFYKDYGKKLEYKDNSGEVEQFEISSDMQPMETDKKEMKMD